MYVYYFVKNHINSNNYKLYHCSYELGSYNSCYISLPFGTLMYRFACKEDCRISPHDARRSPETRPLHCPRAVSCCCSVTWLAWYTSNHVYTHRSLRIRLSLERLIDVVLLCKEISLDLRILEELKVSLCIAIVSCVPCPCLHSATDLGTHVVGPGPPRRFFQALKYHNRSFKTLESKAYLVNVHTSPSG